MRQNGKEYEAFMICDERKEKFIDWLDNQNIKISKDTYVTCFEEVSNYALNHGVTKVAFWDINNYKYFNEVRAKLSSMRLFKIIHRQQFLFVEKFAKIYTDFLVYMAKEELATQQEKPLSNADSAPAVSRLISDSVPSNEEATIKRAKHNSFGYGTIITEAETSYTVQFDNEEEGKTRTISKTFQFCNIVGEEEYQRQHADALVERSGEEKNDTALQIEKDSICTDVTDEEAQLINSFFGNKDYSEAFRKIFAYQKQTCPEITLKEKGTILGARILTEKYRFYADKGGIIRFSYCNEQCDAFIGNLSKVDIAVLYKKVDDTKAFFTRYSEIIALKQKTDSADVKNEKTANKSFAFTIAEAVTEVLREARRSMTAEEIYEEIVRRKLYVFGAQSPTNVVRITIERSCENSLYSSDRRGNSPRFRCVGNKDGKRYYALITKQESTLPIGTTKTSSSNDSSLREQNREASGSSQIQRSDRTQIKVVDFNNKTQSVAFSKPVSVEYFGDVESSVSAWGDVFRAVVAYLYEDYSTLITELAKNDNCQYLSNDKTNLRRPFFVAEELYVEGNKSSTRIVYDIKGLLDLCNVDYENLVIRYVLQKGATNKSETIETAADEGKEFALIPKTAISHEKMTFAEWLTMNEKMAESTCRSYCSSLKSAEEYAISNNLIDTKLTSIRREELQSAVAGILADEAFFEYNKNQHNRLSAALGKYVKYVLGDCVITPTLSTKGISNRKTLVRVQEQMQCSEGLREIITKRFSFGFRIDSTIDMLKLRQVAEMVSVELSFDDNIVKNQIKSAGTEIDGRVYIFDETIKQDLANKVNDLFSKGFSIIYWDIFIEKNLEWLDEHRIATKEIIRNIITEKISSLYFAKNFLSNIGRITEIDAVTYELKDNWGNKVNRSYDELYELLPYIPQEKIRQYMSLSDEFIWVSNGTFARTDMIIINDEQKEAIFSFAKNAIALNGFVSLSDIPLYGFDEDNYELSTTALQTAIYLLVLKSHFVLNGKILTNGKKTAVDEVALAKAYCSTKDECSFEDVSNYVFQLIGSHNRQIAFEAAYDTMVRKDKDGFIADKNVYFDVDKTDELLGQYVDGDYSSITGITAFSLFPICGLGWNHYVLESYCYKYSKKFRLMVKNFNDKNAGIIVKSGMTLKYDEILAMVVAKAGIELSVERIGRFLCDNGYLAKSKYTGLESIADKAKSIREGQ